MNITNLGNSAFRNDFTFKDYYAGGMVMPDRSFSHENYGFGFNGKLRDDEVKGTGNSYDFGARIYDSRVGRWHSIDPLQAKYVPLTPYNFSANNPILFKDIDGKEFVPSNTLTIDQKKQITATEILLIEQSDIFSSLYLQLSSAKEIYNIGLPLNPSQQMMEPTGTFTSVDNNPVYYFFTGKAFEGNIAFDHSAIKPGKVFESALAEEIFHAAQDRYQRNVDKNAYPTTLSEEVEARVFRAYANIYTADEIDVKEFAMNENVIKYFTALREGDKDKIKSANQSFRAQVGLLAKNITRSGQPYSQLGDETNEYVKEGSQTKLFDKLTIDDKKKN